MWNQLKQTFDKAYQEADKRLGGFLPGGGTGNPLSEAIRHQLKITGADQVPYIQSITDRNDEAKSINEMQQLNEREARATSFGKKTGTNQVNLNGPDTTQVKFCPVNRQSYQLAKSAANNYRMNTQNTPDNAMNGCVETVQRTFDSAGLQRVEGADSLFRKHAGNTDELKKGLTTGGRGYQISIDQAGPGDVVIRNGSHAGIITDRKDGEGRYLVNSNSGSHGSFSYVMPLQNKPKTEEREGTTFEVFRLGQPPEDPVRPVGNPYKFSGVNMTSGSRTSSPPNAFVRGEQ